MTTNTRSPNYPAVSLERAIGLTRALWDQEKRSEVPSHVAVQAWGYKSLSGAVRPLLGALRKYGLVDGKSGSVRVSDLGVRLLQYPVGSGEYQRALREAALNPELFREIYESHRDASDDNLRAYLVHKSGFAEPGAKQVIKAFRDTVAFAKLDAAQYSSGEEPSNMPAQASPNSPSFPTDDLGIKFPTAQKPTVQLFSWPLAKGVTAEVRLTGDEIKPAHLERLRQYLDLAKTAMGSDDE
jgi:hypothetical protein